MRKNLSVKELLSNFANLGSILQPLNPVPVHEKYPPSFVITWDKGKHRPQMIRGREYYNNLFKERMRINR